MLLLSEESFSDGSEISLVSSVLLGFLGLLLERFSSASSGPSLVAPHVFLSPGGLGLIESSESVSLGSLVSRLTGVSVKSSVSADSVSVVRSDSVVLSSLTLLHSLASK